MKRLGSMRENNKGKSDPKAYHISHTTVHGLQLLIYSTSFSLHEIILDHNDIKFAHNNHACTVSSYVS